MNKEQLTQIIAHLNAIEILLDQDLGGLMLVRETYYALLRRVTESMKTVLYEEFERGQKQ